jgi:hypothetical protein
MLLNLWFHHDFAARNRKTGGGVIVPRKDRSRPTFHFPPAWIDPDSQPPGPRREEEESLFVACLL